MVTQLADLFPVLLLSGLAALALGPVLIFLGPKLSLLDEPGSAPHKLHKATTPAVGGLGIGLTLTISYSQLHRIANPDIQAIYIGGLVMLVWGILDDRFDLSPWQKLLGQISTATLMILMGVQVQATRLPWLDLLLTVMWFVGMENAFNFIDSMDGLALGLAAIGTSFFMIVTLDAGQPELSLLAAAVLGACLGHFVYNAAPARLFLGDSGSQLLGFMLASIGIAYVPAGAGLPQGVSWFTPILVLGIPIFDMSLVVVSRLRRRVPIYQGGRDHSFHRLLGLGVDSTRSVLLMQFTAVVLGLTAFIALDASVLVANLLFAAIFLIGLTVLIWLEFKMEKAAS